MKGEMLKGHLDLLVLAIIADGPRHGYAIIEALKDRSNDSFDLPEGTVYPVLHRLERAGMLSSEWREHAGRRRRTYQLTPAGQRRLGREKSAWNDFAQAVGLVIGEPQWTVT